MEATLAPSLLKLPSRVKGSHLDKCRKVSIDTNLYRVDFNPEMDIITYAVTYNPTITYDNRKLRLELLNKAMKELKSHIGMTFE